MRKKQRKTTPKNKFITCMEYGSTNCYWVRIQIPASDEYISKTFPFKRHGGKRKALQAAKKFRDEIVKDLGIKHYSRNRDRNNTSKPNKSGVIGVMRQETLKSNGVAYASWIGYYQVKNRRQVKKSFAEIKYGERQAFLNACMFRAQGGDLIVENETNMPCSIERIQQELDQVYN